MAEERRVVTVLFADVAGSTSMGETLDAEDVRALLRRYYDIAKEVVTEHGGVLEKFIGDAVVAVFGLPQTHDDDPQRALASALTLRDRIRDDPALGVHLPVRFGVNTGEVVAMPESATGDFPLTGDAVNVAARLQQTGEAWGILCGERTAASARSAFVFGPPLAVDVRGKAQPVRALALLGRTTPKRSRRTPLIGRDADLAQLELVARRALGEARPFLVSIIAPAGVGKSRLLEEFLDRLPSISPAAVVAIAQCLPYGQRLTYWPLRSVLFRLVGAADDAKAHDVRAAIRAWLEGSGLEALDREVELLAATVGAGESEVSDRSALLAAWRTAFEIAAHRAPLVLVFEDLHWSSDSLLDLFEFVMQPRGALPLLMIALTRPELLDRRPAWGGGRRNYVSISLEPLSDGSIGELVRELLGGSDPDVVEKVVGRAEGNPFFAGELVSSLIEQPSLDRLPDTVQATVLARLDLLTSIERRTIQLGAVFGRAFRLAGVTALDPALRDLELVADQLMAKDLVRAGSGDSLTFRHILIREVAYQTLTRADRARLHAAAAAWVEGQAAGREDALAELIAYHYREGATLAMAQRPGEPETQRIRQKAVHWLSRAGDVATAAAASQEASRHLRSAIELAEPSRLPDLYKRLGDINESGEIATEAYRTALQLCREQGRPPEQELQVLAGLLTIYMRSQGSVANRVPRDAMDRLRAEAAALAARVVDERTLAAYLGAEGFYPFWLIGQATASEIAVAESRATEALRIARTLDDPNLQSLALDALSSCAQNRRAWRECREYASQRLAFQDRLGMVEKIDAHSVVAWSSALLGNLDEADQVSAQGLSQVQPGQVPAWTLHLVAWRIYVLTLLGRWDDALIMGERARQLWLESGRSSAGYSLRGFVSVIDIARAREDRATLETHTAILEEIIMAFPEGALPRQILGYGRADLDAIERSLAGADSQAEHLERNLSLLLDHRRIPPVERLKAILAYAQAREFPILEAQVRRGLGLRASDGAELSRSFDLFERAHAIPYAARVRCERGLITADRSELEAGLQVLERLGDIDQVARYQHREIG